MEIGIFFFFSCFSIFSEKRIEIGKHENWKKRGLDFGEIILSGN